MLLLPGLSEARSEPVKALPGAGIGPGDVVEFPPTRWSPTIRGYVPMREDQHRLSFGHQSSD